MKKAYLIGIIIYLFLLCGCTTANLEISPSETPSQISPSESVLPLQDSESVVTPSEISENDKKETNDIELSKGEGDMSVVLSSLPENLDEFKALAEGKLNDPDYTCALFLCAINLFVEDAETGVEALNILKGPEPLNNYNISWYKDRLRDKKYLPRVYFKGATPENDYQPDQPYVLNFDKDPRPDILEEGFMKLYISAPAYDSPRYFLLRQKGENWYIWEIYSIMTGVRLPASEDPWS